MLITRTPLRISIGGGGTDLPSYYQRRGGFFISAAISKYMFIAINRDVHRRLPDQVRRARARATVEEIEHRIVRTVLDRHELEPGLEIVSTADIPSGAGLGSSGAFTVGLLRAVYAFEREHVTPGGWRRRRRESRSTCSASRSESRTSTSPRSAGLTCFEIDRDGRVAVSPLGGLQGHPPRPRGAAAAVLHRVLALRRRDPRRPAPPLARRRLGDARQPRPDEGARARDQARRSRPASRTGSAS